MIPFQDVLYDWLRDQTRSPPLALVHTVERVSAITEERRRLLLQEEVEPLRQEARRLRLEGNDEAAIELERRADQKIKNNSVEGVVILVLAVLNYIHRYDNGNAFEILD